MLRLLEGVASFRRRVFQPQRELYEELSRGQRPQVCFITCSDSRIDPLSLTNCQPGDLFVLRNAGNLVPTQATANNSEAAGIEFALSLGVRDIVICGHSRCGAMRQLFAPVSQTPSAVERWLKHAEETRRRVTARQSDLNSEKRVWVASQENVLVQLEHVRQIPAVAERLRAGTLTLHGWVYRLETGDMLVHDESAGQFVSVHAMRLATA